VRHNYYVSRLIFQTCISINLTECEFSPLTKTWHRSSKNCSRSQNCNSEIDRWKERCSGLGSFVW